MKGVVGEGTGSAVGDSLGHMKSTATCSLQRQLSASTRSMLQHLKACPTHPSLGLPILDPISFLERCDNQGTSTGLMCGKPCGSCTDWSELMSGSIHDELGPFEGEFIMVYSQPFLKAVCVPGDPPSAMCLKIWRSNRAIADQRDSLLKSYRQGNLIPTAYQNIMYHSDRRSTFQQVNDIVVVLQMPASPSSGYVSHGRPQMKHWLSDGQPRIGILTLFEIDLDISDSRVLSMAVREHTALHHAPAMMTTCTTEGHVIAQNAASRAMLGILGTDHKLTSVPTRIQGHLPTVLESGNHFNYLLELLGSKGTLDEALKQVEAHGSYRQRVHLQSPQLLSLMQLPSGSTRYHEVIITRLRDGVTNKPVYVVVQMDMTEFVNAEQGVARLEHHQRELLREILPDQAINVLLDPKKRVKPTPKPMCIIPVKAKSYTEGKTMKKTDAIAKTFNEGHDELVVKLKLTPKARQTVRFENTHADEHADADENTGAAVPCQLRDPPRHPKGVRRSISIYALETSRRRKQATDLSSGEVQQLSTYHSCVSILFAHIEGFTDIVQKLHPGEVMLFLNDLFNEFDLLVEEHDVYKVETIGDTYMVCSGLFDRSSQQQPSQAPSSTATPADVTQTGQERTSTASSDNTNQNVLGGHDPQHASKMVAFAKALLVVSSSVVSPLGEAVKLHVGVHSGPIMTGVVGRKMPRFCCFGDTVNTASRMMTTSGPDIIHASASFRDLTPDQPWQPTGGIEVKGKGHMDTFQI